MTREILGRMDPDDLPRWRDACAAVQVAQDMPHDLAFADAKRVWLDYYSLVEEMHEKYEVPEEDRMNVTISTGSGLILLEED